MAAGVMVAVARSACYFGAGRLVRFFSEDPQVIAVGDEYLRIVSWTFVASGLIFVASSMFQAMGNTMPALLASFARIVIFAIPALCAVASARFRAALDLVPVSRGHHDSADDQSSPPAS